MEWLFIYLTSEEEDLTELEQINNPQQKLELLEKIAEKLSEDDLPIPSDDSESDDSSHVEKPFHNAVATMTREVRCEQKQLFF